MGRGALKQIITMMTKFPDDRAILQEVNCVVEALILLVHTSLQKFENYNLDEG